jgi:peptidoglycan/xylan/chitin deacetylase (PgdA/CDA1 family)
MPPWKHAAMTAYYHATRPWRWWQRLAAVWAERVPVIVLFYHRIADDRATPWTISNRMFRRQVGWIADRFDLVSLEEAQRRIRRPSNYRPTVALTFDDGYADNCHQAVPWLVRQGIPCTYFVTLHNALTGDPFSHDLVLGHSFAPNTIEQLRAMAAAGIEVGAHGYSHADLGKLHDRRLLHHEVVAAGRDLEEALGCRVRYFAFPFGQYENLSREAFEMVWEAGYEAACSAYGGFNYPGADGFHLQRIPVDDDMIRLVNWVTGDPRKLFTPRYAFEPKSRPRPAREPASECEVPSKCEAASG